MDFAKKKMPSILVILLPTALFYLKKKKRQVSKEIKVTTK